jgi:hypothetical protein
MKFSKWLLASTAFFAAATPVHAEPVTIALFGAAFAATIPGQIVSLALFGAVNYGLSLVSKALKKNGDDDTRDPGTSLTVQMGDDQPVSFTGGSTATAGKRKYSGTWGNDGKTPNAYLVDVIELGNMPTSGAPGVWVNDDKVTVLWAEPEPGGLGFPILEYRRGGTDYLWIRFADGTQTVADPYLRDKFGLHPERPFKSTMVGRGCPYAVMTARYNRDIYINGAPSFLFETGSVRFYDVRKDSTNGGSGPHRWADPSTWEPSSNNAVLIYNIIRGVYYGDEWVYGGQDLPAFRLPSSNWIAAANECDALVNLSGGGTERAFRAGYEFRGNERPIEAIDKLRKGCNGRLAEVGGIFKLLVGAPGAAVYSFTDDDILVTEGQTFTPFPTLVDTVNAVEATYPEPAAKWATKDAPARYSDVMEIEDDNNRLPAGIAFETSPYANQVQRLMLAAVQDARRFRTHQFHLPPDAYALEPNDVVAWTSDRNGYENKKFLVTSIVGARTFNQLVTFKEIDPSDYDWDTDFELPTSDGWIGTITPPPQPMYGWQVEPDVLKDAAGDPWRPTIRVSASPDQDDVEFIWVQVRLAADLSTVFDSSSTRYGSPFSWLLNANFKGNTDYQARGKFIPFSNRETEWSEWLPVTTPYVAASELIADLAHIGQDVKAVFKDLYDTMSRTESLLVQIQQNYQITSSVSQSIGRKLEVSGASFSEQVLVLSSDVLNIAEQTTELSAQLGENFANGLIKFEASADPEGALAQVAILVRAGDGDSFLNSGLYIRVVNDAGTLTSEIALDAQRVVFIDGSDPSNKTPAIVFEDGTAKLAVADIGSVRTADINLGNGKVLINATGITVKSG